MCCYDSGSSRFLATVQLSAHYGSPILGVLGGVFLASPAHMPIWPSCAVHHAQQSLPTMFSSSEE